MSTESFDFSADINQLMHLIVNAFYSKKEVFLRELLSNASDALDKIRYESLTTPSVLGDSSDLKIQILPDKEAKTLSILDTGIGMTKEELINNLGTVAKSGTKAFMEHLQQNESQLDLIGQFGVGFYSAYLVANQVTVFTKNNNDEAYKWQSASDGKFTISTVEAASLPRGTKIVLDLKEDCLDYLNDSELKDLVKRHSQYISFPIELMVEKTKEVEKEEANDHDSDHNANDQDEDDEVKVEEVNEDQKTTTETVTYSEWETINDQKPIWTRKPDQVSAEEYGAFYKSFSNDNGNYSQVKHFSVEGNIEFSSILFIPESKPFDMFQGGEEKLNNKIKLYVRRVFILDNCKDLLPEYLNFVNGLVDSNDLPLNVSREMVQENKILRIIRKQLVKKSIEMMEDLASDSEKYNKFYESFAKNIKLGVYEDSANREKLSALLRYSSTKSGTSMTSLDEYISRMPEEQKSIYYLSGENMKSIQHSPFLEQLKRKDIEVLFMTDAIDEYMLQQVKDYKEKTLIDVSKEDLGLEQSEEEKKQFEEQGESYKTMCEYVKEILGDKVSKVELSNRIVDTPCVLSVSKFGWSANMQRIMKAQALSDNSMHQFMMGQKIFELNPNHRTIKGLKNKYDANKEDKSIKDLVWLLFESSMLNCGFSLEDPSAFTTRINRIIDIGMNFDDDTEEDDNEEVVVETYHTETSDNAGNDTMEQVD